MKTCVGRRFCFTIVIKPKPAGGGGWIHDHHHLQHVLVPAVGVILERMEYKLAGTRETNNNVSREFSASIFREIAMLDAKCSSSSRENCNNKFI